MLRKFLDLTMPSVLTLDDWAIRNSKHTSPDRLVAAALVESFAKEFSEWVLVGSLNQSWAKYKDQPITTYLRHERKQIQIDFTFNLSWKDKEYSFRKIKCDVSGLRVNNQEIDRNSQQYIVDGWRRISHRIKMTQDAAASATKNMERNEQLWNLAEKLLGMKRNEQGALVPIQTAGD